MSNAEVNERTELYTKRSMEDLSSPDQLRDHLKVTGVPVWIIMIAILVLLLGLFAWSAFATLTSYTSANGTVRGGVMAVTLQGEALEKSTLEGTGDKMVCLIGDMGTVLIYGLAIRSHVSPSEYMAFGVAFGLMSTAFAQLADGALSAARIRPILEMASPSLKAQPEYARQRSIVTNLQGGIELNNVSFRYSDGMPDVIDLL